MGMLGLLVCTVAARSYQLSGCPDVELDSSIANHYEHHDQQQLCDPTILHTQFD